MKEKLQEYISINGPTEPGRIARDLGFDEAEVIALAVQWEPRGRCDGPGQNYVAAF